MAPSHTISLSTWWTRKLKRAPGFKFAQFSSRLVDISIFDAEQADRRIEAAVIEWNGFHAYPGMDREVLDGRRRHIRKIDAGNAQIVSMAEQDASGYARPAPKIDDLRARGRSAAKCAQCRSTACRPSAGNMASLVRLIYRAEFLPERSPKAWTFRAAF